MYALPLFCCESYEFSVDSLALFQSVNEFKNCGVTVLIGQWRLAGALVTNFSKFSACGQSCERHNDAVTVVCVVLG
jgi:hypothetical protein